MIVDLDKYNEWTSPLRKANSEYVKINFDSAEDFASDKYLQSSVEKAILMESIPIAYIQAAFWNKIKLPPTDDDYIAMKSSGVIEDTKEIITFKYNPKLNLEENVREMRIKWGSKKTEIDNYVSRLKEINEAFGIEVIKIIL